MPAAVPAMAGRLVSTAIAAIISTDARGREIMAKTNPYSIGLGKNRANYAELTPLTFIERAASVFPDRPAVVHGALKFTWKQTYARARRLASALRRRGIGAGDTVAVMAPNIPAMYEAHFGVPMTGAVLNALNTRLDAEAIGFMLKHGEAKAILADLEFSATIERALSTLKRRPPVIDIVDPEYAGGGKRLGEKDYEAFLDEGDDDFACSAPEDEWDAISLNYTSGTTGDPKGVVYHHRGACLNALCNIITWGMPHHAVYLWTLPMFHCNGWCFPWTVAALAGVNVCLRRVEAEKIFALIKKHRVTHYCGAPIVHTTLINAPAEMRSGISHTVHAMVAGAAPPRAMIEGMERIGFDLIHVYGLTETYGPAAVCARHEDWSALALERRAELNARQGVRYLLEDGIMVGHPDTLEPVPRDGETMGEIFFRGNITMKGYLKNPEASKKAFAGGWFHSGDLAVTDRDGYVRIKDRSKDIIISGGENISSLEVEDVLCRHPAVMAAAVVARPDEKWGETPWAFIELKPRANATQAEIVAFCRDHMAHFKVPRKVIFGSLPRTSTGKIQKFVLRERARDSG
jgi:3-(methylthio)propionyl---CoA ligase